MIDFKGTIIQDEEVLSRLKQDLQLRQICDRILFQRIIDRVAQERGVCVSEEEIQIEADRTRYEKRLYLCNETLNWLSEQLVTTNDWEGGIRDRLLTKKLAEHLFSQDAEKYFYEHQIDFEQILLYRIVVPYHKLAQEISYEIQEGEISFYEAAHIYDADPMRQATCGYEGKFYRWNLKPELSAIVFGAALGKVIGPLTLDQASHLLMVGEFIPAELTPERYQEILDQMFNEWLMAEFNAILSA